MRVLMEKIMDGKLSPVLTAGILAGLSMKGESVEEIVGAVKVMREKAEKIRVNLPVLMDTCGTGGMEKEVSIFQPFVLLFSQAEGFQLQNTGTGLCPQDVEAQI